MVEIIKAVRGGSLGKDKSNNPPSLSSLILIKTIDANTTRLYAEIQNQSAEQLFILRDKGDDTEKTIILISGYGSNQQGGGWSSSTFKGRLRIYSSSASSQFAAYED